MHSLLFVSLLTIAFPDDRKDILLADFEGDSYGDWTVEGKAFGIKPARGTLPGQMAVTGFVGKGLVNSFLGGDDSVGTLSSPPFVIERRFIHLLIGGGKYPGETCIHLMIDGKIVRTATGPNDKPGGSEQLDWHTWDVSEFNGKKATLRIVDTRKGGWGHINVDHIVQSDTKKLVEPAQRELLVEKRFLHLPVRNGAPQRRLKVMQGDVVVREFEIEIGARPDFWIFLDVSQWKGQKLVLRVDRSNEPSLLEAIVQSDSVPDEDKLYAEKDRPQFHFTSRRGWLNDPNGLVYHKGLYHLFYQHNPYGWNWGNMHWGHAVSEDLLHWKEQPIALYPKRFGDWAFSGSAVVDAKNTSSFKKGDEDVLVLAYTSTGRGECIAYSNDAGQTWTEYEGNPVIKHPGRDPKLLWHEASKQWVMALYDEVKGRNISFYTSPDLKKWTYQSRIDGFYECPDLFELPVDGDARKTKWVLYGADGEYLLGHFDSKTFKPESSKLRLWYGNFYAAQTFNNTPDGKVIQIGWGQGIAFPGMPFNQQMTIPVELTLRTTGDGVRMYAQPVYQMKALHQGEPVTGNQMILKDQETPLPIKGTLLRLRADHSLSPKTEKVGFKIRGVPVEYDVKKQALVCGKVIAPLAASKVLSLEILVDRGSIEVFADNGRVAISHGVRLAEGAPSVVVVTTGADTAVRYEARELKSVWQK